MKIQGKISQLTNNGDLVHFTINTEKGEAIPVQVSRMIFRDISNGDVVEIEGDLPSDPPFLARSVVKVQTKRRSFAWMWIAAVIAVCLLIMALYLGLKKKPAPPVPNNTGPALPVPPSGKVQILNVKSKLCLSPAGAARDNNVPTVQFLCDRDPSRMWTFAVVKDDIVKITNVNSERCLTVAGGSNEQNATSVQFNCDDDPSRQWHFAPLDATNFQLVNLHSGQCLGIAGGSTDRNATATQSVCDKDPSRIWQSQP